MAFKAKMTFIKRKVDDQRGKGWTVAIKAPTKTRPNREFVFKKWFAIGQEKWLMELVHRLRKGEKLGKLTIKWLTKADGWWVIG